MGFNYAREKLRFDAEQRRLAAEYRAAGLDEAGIEELRAYDWEQFRKRRSFENRTQELPSNDWGNGCSTLFVAIGEGDFADRFGWIDTIDDPALAGKLARLSDTDKELLTLLAFDGYTQTEIAVMQGCSQQAVSKKINRIKKVLS